MDDEEDFDYVPYYQRVKEEKAQEFESVRQRQTASLLNCCQLKLFALVCESCIFFIHPHLFLSAVLFFLWLLLRARRLRGANLSASDNSSSGAMAAKAVASITVLSVPG